MKHNISLGAIFKNEEPYLKEWIDHYVFRGVEHFYLINDGSTDNFIKILNEYIDKKIVTIFNVEANLTFLNRQYVIYNKFFNLIKDQTKWMIVCDVDEYIWSPLSTNFNDLVSIMDKDNVSIYYTASILFGSNGHLKQPKSIVGSFTKRQNIDLKAIKFIKEYLQTKYICLTSEVDQFGIHVCNMKKSSTKNEVYRNPLLLNTSIFRLNHYRLQSKEKWQKNLSKTDVNCFCPPNACWFSPSLDYDIKNIKYLTDNYRTIKLFEDADKEQNLIEDKELFLQNSLAKKLNS
jgi:hypothetical protein